MLNSVLTRVDFPRPDSPEIAISYSLYMTCGRVGELTNNHDIEVEALTDTLTVPLVGQVGKTDVTRQLSAHNILVLNHSARCGCRREVRTQLLGRSSRFHGRGGLANRRLGRGRGRGTVGI